MNKGGRGIKAKYSTKIVRIPVELADLVEKISNEYRMYVASNQSFNNTIQNLLQVLENNKLSWKVGDTCHYKSHDAIINQLWKKKARITYFISDSSHEYDTKCKAIVLISELY